MQSIQVLDGDYTYAIDQETQAHVASRAVQAKLINKGEWFKVPCGDRGKWEWIFGIERLAAWAQDVVERVLRFELTYHKEIMNGERVGVPTLCSDHREDLACGLLCKGEVFWRVTRPRRCTRR